jgi:BAAT / Acyl-CoA thioester hydrolase C terminal
VAERIAGPILTASGGLDQVWPSYRDAEALHARLSARGFAQRHRDLRFEDAGHGLGAAIPYLPTLTYSQLGGSAAADEAAKARLWPQMLAFMNRLRSG